jgi:glc operon protein GlcG
MLKLNEANVIVQAAIAKAEEMNIKISVTVCDAGGRIVTFNRMDGAGFGGFFGATGKAIASACFRRPSAAVDPTTSRVFEGIAQAAGAPMVFAQGALPIFRDGIIEGACGVGGGTSQQDEDCARAGIAAAFPNS